MSVSVKYKGNEIINSSTDETKTIKTGGKYCEADIVVENKKDGGGELFYSTDGRMYSENVVLPTTITTIGDYAYKNCMGLKSVTIPNSIKEIGAGSFQFCTGLETVILNEGVTTWRNYTFQGCTALKKIYIPKTVVSTGYQSFTDMNEKIRRDVYYAGTIEDWCKIKFGNGRQGTPCADNGVLYINDKAVTDIVIPETITDLSNGGQFAYMPLLKTVIFLNIANIDATTFFKDNNISDIYVPWSEGEVANAPWGATNATIHYNYVGG